MKKRVLERFNILKKKEMKKGIKRKKKTEKFEGFVYLFERKNDFYSSLLLFSSVFFTISFLFIYLFLFVKGR